MHLKEIDKLEAIFLKIINWKISVTQKDFDKYFESLLTL